MEPLLALAASDELRSTQDEYAQPQAAGETAVFRAAQGAPTAVADVGASVETQSSGVLIRRPVLFRLALDARFGACAVWMDAGSPMCRCYRSMRSQRPLLMTT
jgi:hypothetical protein